jgi:cyclin-dependent kinase 7
LLFGATAYTPTVDIWAAGCVFAELMLRVPYMAGENSDLDQLKTIFQALGTPTEIQWPVPSLLAYTYTMQGMKNLPHYVEFQKYPPPPMQGTFTAASPQALRLLQAMLRFDPKKRINAAQVDFIAPTVLGSGQ